MQFSVSQIEGLIFLQLRTCSNPLEKLKTKVGPQCFLEHLILSFAGPRGGYLGSSQQIVIQVDRSFPSHNVIVTERSVSFKTC